MAEYSKSVAEAAEIVDNGETLEENLLQLRTRGPPSSSLI